MIILTRVDLGHVNMSWVNMKNKQKNLMKQKRKIENFCSHLIVVAVVRWGGGGVIYKYTNDNNNNNR
jgi:hypothetical protein